MRFFTSLMSLFLFLLVSPSMAQTGKFEWKEGKSGDYTYRYVTNDPFKARFYTLKNGLTVILSPTNKDPRIQCYVATKAGSKTDPATNTGLAHYLEHMLFKGTDQYGSLDWAKEKPELDKINELYENYNHTTDEEARKAIYRQIDSVSGVASKFAIANEYDKMMSSMGAQGTNAFTSFEKTVYTDDVPASSIDKYIAVQAERFRNPVFRIFHTELEAVYEEKNRGLDNDGRKVQEKLFSELFKNHNYGKQTTIGTIEHLKNPSLLEIRKYFNTYYVPNNMGVIMAGDFDPDVMIRKIDAAFSFMQPREVPKYSFEPEQPITAPISSEVFGPDAESVTMGFRLPGNKDKDVLLADLVGEILTNGKAGLIDLNLVKKQKLLRASASTFTLIDYGILYMSGNPSLGQSLEEVQSLMLGEIENLKKGNFDDDLITSIVNNMKKNLIEESEKYAARASGLMSAFTDEIDWQKQVAYVDQMSRLTKKDIVDFANKYLQNNYVVILKRKGEDKSIVKVDKPPITPVEVNSKSQSEFVKTVNAMPSSPVTPVWIDYNRDMQKSKVGPAEVLYVQNKDNGIFRLRYRYEIGTWNDLKLSMAAQYLQFLGTSSKTSEQFTKEFYKIACSFSMNAGPEYTTVTIEGLQENFSKAVGLFEDLLAHCVADTAALSSMKARIMKSRTDAKANKGAIMAGMMAYARYGAKNPVNNVMSDDDIRNLRAEELVGMLHNMSSYPHRILYYGPESLTALTASLSQMHPMAPAFAKVPPRKEFSFTEQTSNKVLFANYNMVQVETVWVRNADKYDEKQEPLIEMFNNYFGGGMSTVVFQTIRESKALAYSTYASFRSPDKKEDPYVMMGYVGSQADKFNEAVAAMNELFDVLPDNPKNLESAKSSMKNDYETDRITQDGIINAYIMAERMGRKTDNRKMIYESIDKMNFNDLKAFHAKYLSKKPYTYVVLANEKKVSMDDMAKHGEVTKLSLQEIFGY